MKKFTLKFLLIFNLFCNLLLANQLSDVNNKIISLNSQLTIIKEQNASTNDEISILENEKNSLIKSLPALITSSNDFNQTHINSYIRALNEELKRYQANSTHFIQTQISLASANLDKIYYWSLSQISQAFKDYSKTPDEAIIDAITQIQISNYQELKSISQDPNSQNIANELTTLEIKRQTYSEILNYLKDNSELFDSNFVLTSLNLQNIINKINMAVNLQSKSINIGKITIISLVCIFFILLPRVASLLLYRILIAILSRSRNANNELKEQFVAAIKLPVVIFFIIYALNLSLIIAYYPSTISIEMKNYFDIAYSVVIAWFVIGVLDGYGIIILSKIAQKSGRKEVVNLIIKVLYFIVIIITILVILSKIGFDISTIIASLGIGGLAVALATKDIIANFFASILLLFDSSFSQGDWIVCGGIEGTVVEIGLRKTTIRTFDNALVFVPNSKIMSESIKNWNRRKIGRQIKMQVGLSYTTSKQSIQNCINDIRNMLLNHEGIAKSGIDSALNSNDARIKYRQNMVSVDDLDGYKSNLFVVLDEFGDNSINILIYCFSKSVIWGEYLATKEDVMLKIIEIIERYDDASFAFPSRSLYIESIPEIQIHKGEKSV
ncbi:MULTISPECIES: mechanosensitive ion channel family protein [Campylobacter]|uniref:mechanosensitive ion channel family protein n=1 Tax=Campylobacter TaxID=194 RepID=UPI000A33185D|nr:MULTISPECIES: mechanosensitive ion channel family protein [unclassified Campylobacter]MCR8679107.1 mechanosensitive ion channel family protein [Campylobacter sp. RM19072]MCR8696068.1 mechanosensitive ion channel family protein [Campylobacter sp. RM19073]